MAGDTTTRYTDTQRLDAIVSGLSIWSQETFTNGEWILVYFAEYFGVGRYQANNLRAAIDACLDAKGAKVQ
jgi:hypothetical protein